MSLTIAEKRALKDYYDTARKAMADNAATPIRENATERKARIDRLLANPLEFFKYYFPQFCKSEFGWFHKQALKQIVANASIFAVLEWPRAHSKSVFADVLIPLYLKAIGELNGMIVASNNQMKAIGLLIDIQLQLETNARYIADFGEQVQFGDWQDGSFSTRDGIGFWAFGRGQSPRGARKAEKRPDYIVIDDIDDKETCKNPKRVDEGVDWVREDLFGCFDLLRGRFIVAGNRIHRASILAHLVGDVEEDDFVNPKIYHCKVYALENPKTHAEDQSIDGVPAWKERFTRVKLEEIWAKVGYRSAQREYFHKHIQEGKIFQRDWIKHVPMPNLSVYDCIVTYNDPSFKDTKKNDFKAIMAVGRVGRFYHVIDMWVRQATRASMVTAHYDMHERLEAQGAQNVAHWMEANFMQDLILEDYKIEFEKDRPYMLSVREDKRKKPDKYGRIEGISPLFERDVIRFNESLRKSPDFRAFLDQLIGFPAAHDDAPDALEGAIFQINQRSRTAEPVITGGTRRNNRF